MVGSDWPGVDEVGSALSSGRLVEAERMVAQQLGRLRDAGDWVAYAGWVDAVSVVAESHGELEWVRGLAQDLVVVLRQRLVQAMVTLGRVEREHGSVEYAEMVLRRTVELAEEAEDGPGEARALVDLGLLLKDTARISEAKDMLGRALDLLAGDGDRTDLAAGAMAMGLIEEGLNRWVAALGRFEEAAAAFGDIGDRWNQGNALCSIGQAALEVGDEARAEAALREAAAVAAEIGANDLLGDVYSTLAGHALDHDDVDTASELIARAATAFEQAGDVRGGLDVAVSSSFVHRARGEYDQAERLLLDVRETARQRGYPTLAYEALVNAGDGRLLQGDVAQAERWYIEAVQTIEGVRLDLLAEEDAIDFFSSERTEANDHLVGIAAGRGDAISTLEWMERGRARELRRRAGAGLPLGPSAHVATLAGLFRSDDSITAQALAASLGSDVVVVEYHVRSDDVVLVVFDPGTGRAELARVPIDRAGLARFMAANFGASSAVRSLASDTPSLIHQYDSLVEPLVDRVPVGAPVCLVTHGSLHGFPLHVLRAGGTRLIERHPVSYAPSAALLALAQHDRSHRRPVAGPGVAVLGDPTSDLPHARSEAEVVADRLGVEPILGPDVTPDAIIDSFLHHDIVHFAGHAFFDPDAPLRSGLKSAAGVVDAQAIRQRMTQNGTGPSLVVLSACETGVSEIRAGDELLGLARAFLVSRVPTLVVSQWRVSDEATAALMSPFYQAIMRGDTGATAALRSAQHTVGATRPSFYDWAPFIMVGDGRDPGDIAATEAAHGLHDPVRGPGRDRCRRA